MEESRKVIDRRVNPTKPFSRQTFRGNRKKARRKEEQDNYYTDRYPSYYMLLIMLILVLCFVDVYLTLVLIQLGGRELNPIMGIFLKKDIVLLMVIKYAITSICILIFLIHKNFRLFGKIKTQYILYIVLGIFLALVSYKIYLYIIIKQI